MFLAWAGLASQSLTFIDSAQASPAPQALTSIGQPLSSIGQTLISISHASQRQSRRL